jgi:hypothetical protein
MTNLPRRPIEPLNPPPDAFERVLASARARRRRHSLVAATSTMVLVLVAAGSFALGASLNREQQINTTANDPATPSQPANTSTQSSSSIPPGQSVPRAGGGKSGTIDRVPFLRGRAVDPDGNGIAGLYVIPGKPGTRTFSSAGPAAGRTDSRGYYRIVCPRAPVLLATWQINRDSAGGTVGGPWGATFVGSKDGKAVVPDCGSGYRTVLHAGATLTGHLIEIAPNCLPGDDYHLWLWLNGNRATTIRLVGLHGGDTFTYAGLPAGTHTLGLRRQIKTLQFLPGATVEADADYHCTGTTTVPTDSTTQTPPDPQAESPPPAEPSASPSPTLN